jgi:DnaJ homolog subfamily C member 19
VGKILVFAAIGVVLWRLVTGRWPWQSKPLGTTKEQALFRARKLLNVREGASQGVIVEAHRRLVASVHPDRGGSARQVHEANEARDLLLAELPQS